MRLDFPIVTFVIITPVYRATQATIMLGMNDVNRASFATKIQTPHQQTKFNQLQADAEARYLEHMTKIIERLLQNSIEVTLIKPSIYDQTAQLPKENLLGVMTNLPAMVTY